MLSDEEVKQIINQANIEIGHKLELIQQYIHEKKSVDVGKINVPYDMVNTLLMDQAFGISLNYFKKKFDE